MKNIKNIPCCNTDDNKTGTIKSVFVIPNPDGKLTLSLEEINEAFENGTAIEVDLSKDASNRDWSFTMFVETPPNKD